MADLPKRELGRTGLQVTMLGYGAMELRGVPRGREVTEAQSKTGSTPESVTTPVRMRAQK